ncbi:Gfo/Idh/MocA family oxidoreductase [Rhodococcus pseudokoreensis]|uniref:Gfo/Idh/MocA family oxidoreductase n=1 Tax=Rhodococcus pseudokoreensis TaxID=2811421 RepID=A0A974ZV93_9NOCA|nr:Gfo/Idh/MocA family oxidoreductase [Rhodococcus pseudokoreensis]QSE91466.1 Gfo/Idh/MocA family oxidoreductase [Rhodococcus pseudokoreensis]
MTNVHPTEIAVAVAGFGWMGRVHTNAYLRQRHHFPEAPTLRLAAVADEVPGRAEEAAAQFGFGAALTDWRDIAADENIDAVSITAPNFLHREIGVAMAEAGKHIWIEKPVGLSSEDAKAVAAAVEKAGVQSTVGFNYRHAPAVAMAHDLIASGELGTITHARFRFLSDYAAHPDGALSWRYENARGGSGVLGDLASHGVDLVRYLLGDIDAVVADTAVFIPQRAVPTGATSGHARATGGKLGPVENDDFVSALLRLASGGRVTLDASRVAVGEQNNYGFEIHGTKGAVYWDFRRMNELGTSLGSRYQDQPVTTVWVGPDAGAYARFQPGSASSMSYDDLKVIEGNNFITSIVDGKPQGATIADAVAAAETLDAITASVASGAWVGVR